MAWTKEEKAEYMKKYRAENKERLLKRAREYKQENKEQVYNKKLEWNDKNKEKINAQKREAYRRTHPKKTPASNEPRRERRIESYRRNREKRIAYSVKYEKENIKAYTRHTAWRYFYRLGLSVTYDIIEAKTNQIELVRAIKKAKKTPQIVRNRTFRG